MLRKRILSFDNISNYRDLVKFYTGFEDATAFMELADYLADHAKKLPYWKGKRTPDNVNYSASRCAKSGRPSNMADTNKLFLVLVRLRVGFPVVEMSRIFGIALSQVSCIFTKWICFLYHELRELFPIPEVDIIRSTTPECFSNYPDTSLLIDCTEIQVQKPFALHAQREMFSTYKHYNTVKFLVAATPVGLVCFVSSVYGGVASDKEIVQESGFLTALEPGHSIMADKGFQIADLMPAGIHLNIPPKFMKKRDGQMPESDVFVTREIASEHVHIERVIRRIKTYRILDHTLPLTLRDIINQIVTVCALLTNFKAPLIRTKPIAV